MSSEFYTQYRSEFEVFIKAALKEDIGSGDHSSRSCIDPMRQNTAVLWAKEEGIIAGLELAAHIFHYYDPKLQFDALIEEGAKIKKGVKV